jgi:hypothetical protein
MVVRQQPSAGAAPAKSSSSHPMRRSGSWSRSGLDYYHGELAGLHSAFLQVGYRGCLVLRVCARLAWRSGAGGAAASTSTTPGRARIRPGAGTAQAAGAASSASGSGPDGKRIRRKVSGKSAGTRSHEFPRRVH